MLQVLDGVLTGECQVVFMGIAFVNQLIALISYLNIFYHVINLFIFPVVIFHSSLSVILSPESN